jgi:hypothetical protein
VAGALAHFCDRQALQSIGERVAGLVTAVLRQLKQSGQRERECEQPICASPSAPSRKTVAAGCPASSPNPSPTAGRLSLTFSPILVSERRTAPACVPACGYGLLQPSAAVSAAEAEAMPEACNADESSGLWYPATSIPTPARLLQAHAGQTFHPLPADLRVTGSSSCCVSASGVTVCGGGVAVAAAVAGAASRGAAAAVWSTAAASVDRRSGPEGDHRASDGGASHGVTVTRAAPATPSKSVQSTAPGPLLKPLKPDGDEGGGLLQRHTARGVRRPSGLPGRGRGSPSSADRCQLVRCSTMPLAGFAPVQQHCPHQDWPSHSAPPLLVLPMQFSDKENWVPGCACAESCAATRPCRRSRRASLPVTSLGGGLGAGSAIAPASPSPCAAAVPSGWRHRQERRSAHAAYEPESVRPAAHERCGPRVGAQEGGVSTAAAAATPATLRSGADWTFSAGTARPGWDEVAEPVRVAAAPLHARMQWRVPGVVGGAGPGSGSAVRRLALQRGRLVGVLMLVLALAVGVAVRPALHLWRHLTAA